MKEFRVVAIERKEYIKLIAAEDEQSAIKIAGGVDLGEPVSLDYDYKATEVFNPETPEVEDIITSWDGAEFELCCTFYDGFAVSLDKVFLFTYPRMDNLTEDDKRGIRQYDGIPEPRVYTPRDICLTFGEIHKI